MDTIPCSINLRRQVACIALASALACAGTVEAHAQSQLISPVTHVWKYSADNSDQYTAGFPNVDDSAWSAGLPLFGNDATGHYPYPFTTFVPGSGGGVQTAYYRAHFPWTGSTGGVTLAMTNMVDDGIVIYLNGTEIVRWNVNAPAFSRVSHETQAASADDDVLFGTEVTRGPAMPALHIAHESPNTVAITWTPAPDVRLFTAGSVGGAFTAVSGNPQGRYAVTLPANEAQFFRLGY